MKSARRHATGGARRGNARIGRVGLLLWHGRWRVLCQPVSDEDALLSHGTGRCDAGERLDAGTHRAEVRRRNLQSRTRSDERVHAGVAIHTTSTARRGARAIVRHARLPVVRRQKFRQLLLANRLDPAGRPRRGSARCGRAQRRRRPGRSRAVHHRRLPRLLDRLFRGRLAAAALPGARCRRPRDRLFRGGLAAATLPGAGCRRPIALLAFRRHAFRRHARTAGGTREWV